jgi:hypothetical protein
MDDKNMDNKPALAPKWFWDFDYNKIDWLASYKTIIARIVDRGSEKEWMEIIRFYGKDKVLNTLQYEITFLPDYAIDEVSKFFEIAKEEMLCYTNKQSKQRHWI